MDLITSTDALASACARLAAHPFVTIDTEFLRETTYYPKLCLIQMAGPDPADACLIDPLAEGMSLDPFMGLMGDRGGVKGFHSARPAGPAPADACLIDPLAEGMSLDPFMGLMGDRGVVKVFHSARQDLEIV